MALSGPRVKPEDDRGADNNESLNSGADDTGTYHAGERAAGIGADATGDAQARATLLAEARQHLDAAVTGLRRAGTEDHIPRGLLARPALRRDVGEFGGCQEDLTGAQEIAARGGMRLFLTDYYLEWGRMVLAMDPALTDCANRTTVTRFAAAAIGLITATGYHRRDPELAALQAALAERT